MCNEPDHSNLVGVIVHGDSAALAHGEVDVGNSTVWHLILLPPAATQHPRVPHRVLGDGLVLQCDVYLALH